MQMRGSSRVRYACLSALDRLDIQDFPARCAWTFDTGDVEGFVACFAGDAVVCEDMFQELDLWSGSVAIRAMAEFLFSGPSLTGRQHHISQILIDGRGEEASLRPFCFVTDCTGEPPYAVRFAGHYFDHVVRENRRRPFKSRLICDWSGKALATLPGQTGLKRPRVRPRDLIHPD
jgi:hypothetical protein